MTERVDQMTDADAAFERFLERYPEYAETSALDDLRRADYGRLDAQGQTYLDYTGGGLYADSQVRRHHELLAGSVLGNPHSHNPTSLASTALVEAARAAVLDFFRADPGEYEVVFTANASGALKTVGEAYPFAPGGRYLLSYDNHNSVNGIREFARRGGAAVTYLPVSDTELRLDPPIVAHQLCEAEEGANNLFAFPAQSNFSGVQHPLELVQAARELGWHVLLDSAAFAPTNRLDLSAVRPDFVPLSFYKMFGYPTGVGALVARRDALAVLRRPWFAGGTISLASVQGEGWHHLLPGAAGFEDGTVDYLSLPAITIGLEHVARIGIDKIHTRVLALTGWLLESMGQLQHSNGAPLVRVFGPRTTERRGATVAFYLLDPEGAPYDVDAMEGLAGRRGISLRTGCFCNPGDGEIAHRLTRDDMAECFVERPEPVAFKECRELILDSTGKTPNTMRVSLGLASDFADVHRFVEFAAGFADRDPGSLDD